MSAARSTRAEGLEWTPENLDHGELLLVAAVIYITVGYETADESGAVTPAPERLEDSPVVPDDERLRSPAPERDERTAPEVPPPDVDPERSPAPAHVPEPET